MVKCCGIICYNIKNQILLVKGNPYKGRCIWSFPKGHIEDSIDTDFAKCSIREFREETGRILEDEELFESTFKTNGQIYFIVHINSEDLPHNEFCVDKKEIRKIEWVHEKYIKNLEHVNAGIRFYIKKVINPKYKRQKKKKIVEDGWQIA